MPRWHALLSGPLSGPNGRFDEAEDSQDAQPPLFAFSNDALMFFFFFKPSAQCTLPRPGLGFGALLWQSSPRAVVLYKAQ